MVLSSIAMRQGLFKSADDLPWWTGKSSVPAQDPEEQQPQQEEEEEVEAKATRKEAKGVEEAAKAAA
eukprot:8537785-Lingulodinium_polyedra.AAC.1